MVYTVSMQGNATVIVFVRPNGRVWKKIEAEVGIKQLLCRKKPLPSAIKCNRINKHLNNVPYLYIHVYVGICAYTNKFIV